MSSSKCYTKIIAPNVFERRFINRNGETGTVRILHDCEGNTTIETLDSLTLNSMVLRENEKGPMYWCGSCGFTIEEGQAFAIRLNEVDI